MPHFNSNFFNSVDKQLEGISVDREYVKKRMKEKLFENLDIHGKTEQEKDYYGLRPCS